MRLDTSKDIPAPPGSDTPVSTPKTWKNIGIRAVTGLLVAFIAFVPFYFGGLFWWCLVTLFALSAVWEWVRMSDPQPTILAFLIPILGVIFMMISAYHGAYKLGFSVALLWAALAGFERLQRGRAVWASFGFLYIIIPAILFVFLRGKVSGIYAPGFQDLLYVILLVVAADTGAYLGGSYFRGPKIAPKLSPNKTWSGFVSGLSLAAIIAVLFALVLKFSPIYSALFSIPIVIFSVFGDFLESWVKRRLDVKDTGGLLPGHGGVLDRVDSLMMAVVFAAFILTFLPHVWPIL